MWETGGMNCIATWDLVFGLRQGIRYQASKQNVKKTKIKSTRKSEVTGRASKYEPWTSTTLGKGETSESLASRKPTARSVRKAKIVRKTLRDIRNMYDKAGFNYSQCAFGQSVPADCRTSMIHFALLRMITNPNAMHASSRLLFCSEGSADWASTPPSLIKKGFHRCKQRPTRRKGLRNLPLPISCLHFPFVDYHPTAIPHSHNTSKHRRMF